MSIVGTVDLKERIKFSKLSSDWGDSHGSFSALHKMNPVRLEYIIDAIELHFDSIHGIQILDIGCGGGLVAEPFARLGARVTGIDPVEENIDFAQQNANLKNLDIKYICSSLEEYDGRFDVIIALEVVEHVENLEMFIEHCAKKLNPGGLLFISSINRNIKSLLMAKCVAEYILHLLPLGTHSWKKFVKPSELAKLFRKNEMTLMKVNGMKPRMLHREWQLSSSCDVNYILYAIKE